MPYRLHPDATTPHDDTVIWRYMDLPKFLMLLEQKALYFSLLEDLEDKWEAVIDRKTTRSIISAYAPSMTGNVISGYQGFSKIMAVNCWYRGHGESIAMWALYTGTIYGVAIKTTVGNLKRALVTTQQIVHLGDVEYRDHDQISTVLYNPDELTPLKAILQKRVCYQHECELRAFTIVHPIPDNPYDGQRVFVPFPKEGLLVNVDLNPLIESITLGPRFPTWARYLLESALLRAEIKPPTNESDAFKPPSARFIV
jgi:hypothetical protein